jgi:hypothetical protein
MNITQLRKLFIKHSFKLILIALVILLIYMCVKNTRCNSIVRQSIEHSTGSPPYPGFKPMATNAGKETDFHVIDITMYYREAATGKEKLITFTYEGHETISLSINSIDNPVCTSPTKLTLPKAFTDAEPSKYKIIQYFQIGYANIFEFAYNMGGGFGTFIILIKDGTPTIHASWEWFDKTLAIEDFSRYWFSCGILDGVPQVVWRNSSHQYYSMLPGGLSSTGTKSWPSSFPREPHFAMNPGRQTINEICTGIYTSYIDTTNTLHVRRFYGGMDWHTIGKNKTIGDKIKGQYVHSLEGYHKIIGMFFVTILGRRRDRLYIIAQKTPSSEGICCKNHDKQLQQLFPGKRTSCSQTSTQTFLGPCSGTGAVTRQFFCPRTCPGACAGLPPCPPEKSYTYDIIYFEGNALECDFHTKCSTHKNFGIHEFTSKTEIGDNDYVFIDSSSSPPELKITTNDEVCKKIAGGLVSGVGENGGWTFDFSSCPGTAEEDATLLKKIQKRITAENIAAATRQLKLTKQANARRKQATTKEANIIANPKYDGPGADLPSDFDSVWDDTFKKL